MDKADYRIASQEEREKVVRILQRNVNLIIEQKQSKNSENLRKIVDGFCVRIRNGDIISGKEFQQLLKLFKKQPIE